MPTLSTIMRRAWRLMSDHCGYRRINGIAFSRASFAWCLRAAWTEARQAAAIGRMSDAELAERIADLQADLTWAGMRDSRTALAEMAVITAELAKLHRPTPYQLTA